MVQGVWEAGGRKETKVTTSGYAERLYGVKKHPCL